MLTVVPGLDSFHPASKCCTYTPALPNFLVGAGLTDPRLDEVDGRSSLHERIRARVGVMPIGLTPSAIRLDLAHRSRRAFGQTPSLRCPHYHAATGKCGVWLHRNAICSTWFCKHERGAVGQAFWRAVRQLFSRVEYELARWCLLELGAPHRVDELDRRDQPRDELSAADIEDRVNDRDYAATWGDWLGREQELYERSHQLVAGLSWAEVSRITGPEVGLAARALAEARARRMQTFVPTSLVVRRLEILHHGDPYVLASYTGTDPVAIPAVLFDVLPAFRGQPTGEAREEIARETGIELDDALLRRLVDFEVLEEP